MLGIRFSDAQIGRFVKYLDVLLYIDDDGQIQYRLFRKETDARNYLHTSSFHPSHVFESVAFSQMVRVISRNSKDSTCVTDLCEIKQDLIRCGHKEEKLEELEPKAVLRVVENASETKQKPFKGESLVFTTKFIKDIDRIKSLIRSVVDDIKLLVGPTRIIFALKKHESVQNKVVKNRGLSKGPSTDISAATLGKKSQACGRPGCETCPLLFDFDENIIVNGIKLVLNKSLTCKDENLIYVAQCTICNKTKLERLISYFEDSYFGQTIQEGHLRFNGHRSKFKTDNFTYQKSALSQHCFNEHHKQFNLNVFKIGFVKQCQAIDLDREESRYITKFRTRIFGINRIKVIR